MRRVDWLALLVFALGLAIFAMFQLPRRSDVPTLQIPEISVSAQLTDPSAPLGKWQIDAVAARAKSPGASGILPKTSVGLRDFDLVAASVGSQFKTGTHGGSMAGPNIPPDGNGAAKSINVAGRVRFPGRYQWPRPDGGNTVVDAIKAAGGFDETAIESRVRIIHLNPNRATTVTAFDADATTEGRSTPPVVYPNDIVFVPQRSLAQLEYLLQPSDLIRVTIASEPDLQRIVRLSADSTIVLPLLGDVNLKGRTVVGAQELIQERYGSQYLDNPRVRVTVEQASERGVNVLGAVNAPGRQPLAEPLLLTISAAGGFTHLANRQQIRITHVTTEGQTSSVVVNADLIMQGAASDPLLQPGDVVFVPERAPQPAAAIAALP